MLSSWSVLRFLVLLWTLHFAYSSEFFKPFNVSYDHRAIVIDGKRRMLISAGIHYPRATPEMWPDIILKSKEGGADVVQSYVFWNGHEPIRGQYNFEGRYDLVKFVKLIGSSGLYLHLRIGPYACAEWNFGGFPVWLRDLPGIEFRTNNAVFKDEMQRFVKKIVDLMKEEMLLSWQGGPIIMMQIENEYGNIEGSYAEGGKEYVKWAASMALGLGAGVPWVMCRQWDAPENIIDSCNAFYCDGFRPNSYKKPALWTEDWNGWYTSWGEKLPHRPVEDNAFAIARFFQRGGSFHNYYMFFGGTNFGRTSGGPFDITSYDYDAPIDEYGLITQPKWGHLKDLHAAIKLCEPALVAVDDSPQYIWLGPHQEAHVYRFHVEGLNLRQSGNKIGCSAFLANIDWHWAATVTFLGRQYTLPPWSVSILPDCKNVAFNTAKVGAQISIKTLDFGSPLPSIIMEPKELLPRYEVPFANSKNWKILKETVGVWGDNFTVQGVLEHLNVTKDKSDYLWYITRIHISDDDVSYWEENGVNPRLSIDRMRDVVRIFINGQLAGTAVGSWVRVVQPVHLLRGDNELALLSETVGLQNYGAFIEKDGAGFGGKIRLTGLKNGDIDLTKSFWTHQVGLKGEFMRLYGLDENEQADWMDLALDETPSALTWYKTYFDAPKAVDPVSLNLDSMGKGQAWVNGHSIGRFWSLVAPKNGCPTTCDYRGTFYDMKCATNCGKPTQSWYHIPRSWLKASNNLLVLFDETGGNPLQISIKSRATGIICAQVSETHYAPLSAWSRPAIIQGKISIEDVPPEIHLQCDSGHVISSITFASYGTPGGGCQSFSIGNCHAPSSMSVVADACQGRNSCSVNVSNAIFGDPCRAVIKTLAVEARCTSSLDISDA
ncbi:beta-galactosidase 9 [Macadamia integrifolia]|uniref:beta-galactosidase 9 n=1 Tax=Macadamia integrifolia TaxID=60698 RepID=UPI001C4EA536|nr:beta-galactosidase 9 [Macadamia integrifolia]